MAIATRSDDRSTTEPSVLLWHLDASFASIGRLRRELSRILDRRGVPPEAHEVVLLVAHELAANAVEHVGSGVHVVADFSATAVLIGVGDGSTTAPQLQPMNPFAARGRGLQMVDVLASRWCWRVDRGGKTVWAEVSTHRPTDPDPPAPPGPARAQPFAASSTGINCSSS